MVQVIPASSRERSPSKSAQFSEAFGRGLQAIQQHQQQQKMGEQLKNITGMDLSGLPPEMQKIALAQALKSQGEESLFNKKQKQETEFEGRDYQVIEDRFGKKFADIWKASPVGGRTKLLQHAIEAFQRGVNLEDVLSEISPSGNQNNQFSFDEENQENAPISSEENEEQSLDKEIKDYLKKQDQGLLPSEKFSRGKERFDAGLKKYEESGTKLRSMARDKERLDILDSLNRSKKLPQDLGRANVDPEGNLRLPYASTPAAERYVKTLNEFSQGAKDTFGSRVTNFDLTQYLKRFPTLMNSEEGRRQLIEQMKIVNQINSVYYKNLKNVYDKAGGVRNIDADVAERFAEKASEAKVNSLSQKFNDIGEFSSKPAASEFKGKKIRDKDTGEVFISDGNDWVPAE